MDWSPCTQGSSRGQNRALRGGMTPPATPMVVPVVGGGGDAVVEWDAVFGAIDYRIEVGSAPGLSDELVTHVGSTATTYDLSALGSGTYYVRIFSVGAFGGDWQTNYGPSSTELLVAF